MMLEKRLFNYQTRFIAYLHKIYIWKDLRFHFDLLTPSACQICLMSAIYNNIVLNTFSLNLHISDMLTENDIRFRLRFGYKIYIYVLIVVYCDTCPVQSLIYVKNLDNAIFSFLSFMLSR